ncbi:hypothetical protein [Herpetosiphon geysericola]|uniref:Uncharacterized protein n=1 Tax=Herpetosiphon geysericola TaxID=70996 RepID=A0A0P6Y0B1_9CHLR|nr:hypothetical protein [Herpetosiphon geysericola]KPL90760.1 hypothetical protein SE18_05180 [Herpetosiphon geysericola]
MGLSVDTINAMQEIHRGITGVKTAPDVANYPAQLNQVDCPMVLVWPGDATWTRETINESDDTRSIYTVTVFVAPAATGMRGELIVKALDCADALREYYQSDDGQTLNGFVEITGPDEIRYTGLRTIKYNDIDWYALQVIVPTVQQTA